MSKYGVFSGLYFPVFGHFSRRGKKKRHESKDSLETKFDTAFVITNQ